MNDEVEVRTNDIIKFGIGIFLTFIVLFMMCVLIDGFFIAFNLKNVVYMVFYAFLFILIYIIFICDSIEPFFKKHKLGNYKEKQNES